MNPTPLLNSECIGFSSYTIRTLEIDTIANDNNSGEGKEQNHVHERGGIISKNGNECMGGVEGSVEDKQRKEALNMIVDPDHDDGEKDG